MKTRYQISHSGCYSDWYWEHGWRVSLVFQCWPIFIFKWTSPPLDMTKKERQELFAKLDNAIFPSREDNGVEHVKIYQELKPKKRYDPLQA